MRWSQFVVPTADGATRYIHHLGSGQTVQLSDAELDRIERFLAGEDGGVAWATLEPLVRSGAVVNDKQDEIGPLEAVYRASQRQTKVMELTVVASLGCNFDCPYCFEDKHPSLLSEQVAAGVVELVGEAISSGLERLHVAWFGGEPLLGLRPLLALGRQLLDLCDAHDVVFTGSVHTNGYLLTEEVCEQLQRIHVVSVETGLDGPPDLHDRWRSHVNGRSTFTTVVANIEAAVRFFPVAVRINVSSETAVRAAEVLPYLAGANRAGKLSVYLAPLVTHSETLTSPANKFGAYEDGLSPSLSAAFEDIFNEAKRQHGFACPLPKPKAGVPCTAVRGLDLVIGSDGTVWKCWDSVGNADHALGNLGERNWDEHRLQRWMGYDPFSDEECRACVALPVCMGGCALHATQKEHRDQRCDAIRYNAEQRVRAHLGLAITATRPWERRESTTAVSVAVRPTRRRTSSC